MDLAAPRPDLGARRQDLAAVGEDLGAPGVDLSALPCFRDVFSFSRRFLRFFQKNLKTPWVFSVLDLGAVGADLGAVGVDLGAPGVDLSALACLRDVFSFSHRFLRVFLKKPTNTMVFFGVGSRCSASGSRCCGRGSRCSGSRSECSTSL